MSCSQIRFSREGYAKAWRFAALSHGEQKVPGSSIPYLFHVGLVTMELVGALEEDLSLDGDLAISCSLLHDVLEDTSVSYGQLELEFGSRIALGVLALSKDSTVPKPERMADSLQRIKAQPREVWTVKMADRSANLEPPPPTWLPAKIRKYAKEAKIIHAELKEACEPMAQRLECRIRNYESLYLGA